MMSFDDVATVARSYQTMYDRNRRTLAYATLYSALVTVVAVALAVLR